MRVLFLLAIVCLGAQAQVRLYMRRVTLAPFGHGTVRLVLADTDHDGRGEVIFSTGQPIRWEIVEYRHVNRYELVKSDTGALSVPDSLLTGNFRPYDAGDIDRDGKADLVGEIPYGDSAGHLQKAFCTIESRDSASYPDSLNWWVAPDPGSSSAVNPRSYCDLDQDSVPEFLTQWGPTTAVFENVGDNRESVVCQTPNGMSYCTYQFADYDQNGRVDYVYWWGVHIYVCECTGDNQYAPVCSLRVAWYGIVDMFSGHDADRNGRPEFFVVKAVPAGMYYRNYLYQFEAQAEHDYVYNYIDTIMTWTIDVGRNLCADLDGDSIEELVWGGGTYVRVYKATGPHEFERVTFWSNDQQGGVSVCNAADYNGNGYKELFVGGNVQMSVLEVEAIRVLNPDTNHSLRAGDTCEIRWRIFEPPRCDSVSLFLKTDTAIYPGERFWRLDTIATGLPPTDSTFDWVVLDTVLDRAWVVAIAYGPGWQYDESDSAFAIAPPGVAETPRVRVCDWALTVSPNPALGRAAISYDIPRRASVRLGLYDAGGRLMQELVSGEVEPGRYYVSLGHRDALPAGIYFIRLDAPGFRDVKKAVVMR